MWSLLLFMHQKIFEDSVVKWKIKKKIIKVTKKVQSNYWKYVDFNGT